MDSKVARNSIVIIAVILSAYALYWLRGIVTPLALAIFLLVMVDGLARIIGHRVRGLPPWAPLPAAILVSILAFGLTVYTVAANAAGFAAELVDAAPRLNAQIADIAGRLGIDVPPTVQGLINQLNPIRYVGNVAGLLQAFGSNAAYVLIYLGFLLASRPGIKKKAEAMFHDARERDHATAVFLRIRYGVERYLWIQTVTGAIIAVGSWAVMAAFGLSSPIFWAFLIFVVCYIPVIGGFVAGILPALFALVQFPTWWPAVIIFASIHTILFVVGNVVLPKMQKDNLNLDPVVVLLSLAFWGAIWGITGAFLSTPITVAGIIILAQFSGTRWIAILLSADGDPELDRIEVPARLPSPKSHTRDE